MRGAPRRRRAALAAAAALLVADAASAETLRVFAAASLTDAFRQIAAAFEQQHADDSVELSFAGSQLLTTQIEQGARADVFASADVSHAQRLVQARLLLPYTVFARNRIVVVVPRGAARVRRLRDLVRPGLKLVLAGPSVPVGRYTEVVLRKLAGSGLFGDDFQARVQANVVSRESNVRAVLSKVALGEADAGFVYATDVRAAAGAVRTIEIPDPHNVVAEYAVGVVAGDAPAAAQSFVDLLLGDEGQRLLREQGFSR